uniref:HPS1 biogenesis of lysosomal organelles complex 3 subunit 1 n=1 Tax=Paramormyrops kingsleyae TaxID=1676925 RepID=A0A3B3S490_9TELE
MKCLLIASESAEVLFYWADPDFQQSIRNQYEGSQEEGGRPPAFEDSINTLFAPIIISCSTMIDRMGDSYTSFSTEDQHVYVLRQFEDCLYIAVNGDGEESEEDLKRKIYVMKKLTEVHFGMVTLSSPLLRRELRPHDTDQRNRLWRKFQSLLGTYSRLREQDQSFLVEAVERLVQPTLCEQCIEFLERRLVQTINSSAERAGEEALHAFILVHTKLLAFYSRTFRTVQHLMCSTLQSHPPLAGNLVRPCQSVCLSACQPACLSDFLPACLSACQSACLAVSSLPACQTSFLPVGLSPACLLDVLLASLSACQSACLSVSRLPACQTSFLPPCRFLACLPVRRPSCLSVCLSVCLPGCLSPACLSDFLPACLFACQSACLSVSRLPACQTSFLPVCLSLARLPACLSVWQLLDALSVMFSLSIGAEQACVPVFQFVDPDIQVAEDSLQALEAPPMDPAMPSRVFLEATLKDGFCPMMPHSMYCLPLWPGITLVLLTKIHNCQVAVSVYYFLNCFTQLERKLSDLQFGAALPRSQHSLHDLRSKMDKFVRALGSSSSMQHTWNDFKNKVFSRGGPRVSKELLPHCRNMKTQLCNLYRQCFVADGPRDCQRLAPSLQERARLLVQEQLLDWKDFLLVKSRRNVTMVSYLEEFPGMVHFIYVDRTTGQMIAPSLSVTDHSISELGTGPLARFIKSKVWSCVGTARHYLQKGYTTVTFRDGDYYCCYFLWVESETGYKLEVVDPPVLSDDSAPVGMLAWDYYRKLLRYYTKNHQTEVVKCYELLTIHLGVIPSECILQHCYQLACKLWEPSRIPLL